MLKEELSRRQEACGRAGALKILLLPEGPNDNKNVIVERRQQARWEMRLLFLQLEITECM